MTRPPAPSSPPATGPNAEQIRYWNEVSGPRWVAAGDRLDAQISPLGLVAMERAGVAEGERVIDVGCGCGQTSVQLGLRVGRSGAVVGVDLSAVMLARASLRAEQAGLAHVRFENADAQTHAFEPRRFDLVFSRFGVMFFADPRAAFANLREALVPGGRLAFLCWQELGRNEWARVPMGAAARHVELPAPPPPGAPGPFAFADPERTCALLRDAGFAEVSAESVERPMAVAGGGGLAEAVEFLLQIGPASAALREHPERREAVADALREALRAHETPEGVVMGAAAWLVTARSPMGPE